MALAMAFAVTSCQSDEELPQEELPQEPTNELMVTTGTATRTDSIEVTWVQLWENGPKFAEYNVGVTDGKVESCGEYYNWSEDIASEQWGSNWRMPTKAELEELIASCEVEWTAVNGVKGRKFTGKDDYSSNSVFFPAAGYCNYGFVGGQDEYGNYWSLSSDADNKAFYLDFLGSDRLRVCSDPYSYGFSVRAVLAE